MEKLRKVAERLQTRIYHHEIPLVFSGILVERKAVFLKDYAVFQEGSFLFVLKEREFQDPRVKATNYDLIAIELDPEDVIRIVT